MQEINELLHVIKSLPQSAGIYQYLDKNGKLLYVGKAKELSKRVKSYWRFTPTLKPNPNQSLRILKMLDEVVSLEYIVVSSEHDALILENSLIKQLNPKYNILLRDDKTYPYIYIDESEDYPRFEITRRVIKGRDIKYFGPYSIGARDIYDSIYELCQLVQKKSCLKGKKACLYQQIEKCLAPCEGSISVEEYKKIVAKGVSYIQNKKTLLKDIEQKMLFYAQNERFEEAATLRDRIIRIQKSEIKSSIDVMSSENYDIFALAHSEKKAVMMQMFMRDGKIISSSSTNINLLYGADVNELYSRSIVNFYGNEKPPIVVDVLCYDNFDEKGVISEHLTNLFGKKVKIISPQKGVKRELTQLAFSNAKELLIKKKEQSQEVGEALKELCSLQRVPLRVETFDNSHMGGTAPVGAMVVYDDNRFEKESYRLYHLKALDEYAQMRETLTRRVESFEKNPPPDLWVLDGGRTLLLLAQSIIESCGVNLDVIAISKEKIDAKSHRAKGRANDEIHTINDSFKLQPSDKRLQFVQLLRDEAHRSAIGFHKKSKLKLDKQSKLLHVKGVSEAKVKKLLLHFGTFEALKKLSVEEIAEVLNMSDALKIKEVYSDRD
ncbi:MAG: excinuclease ABC subunit UvrC [Campylobacterota bacterium]|nr:excinuclease ABC subunit UvrC [Campylobacterota bacterium]